MRIMKFVPVAAVLAALGCSGETVASPANLAGTWNFTFNTANSDAKATCVGSMTFTITQTDQTFVGTQQGPGSLTCTGVTVALARVGQSDSGVIANEVIGTGVVGSSDLVFTMNLLNGTSTGMVTKPGEMSGMTTWTIPVAPKGSVTVMGTFTAVKQ